MIFESFHYISLNVVHSSLEISQIFVSLWRVMCSVSIVSIWLRIMFNKKIIVGPPGRKKILPLLRYQIDLCISRSGWLTESFRRLFSTKLGLTGRSEVPTWGIFF
jgi:hypothetical protein